MSKSLLMFKNMNTPTQALAPAAERLIAGVCAQTIRNHYTDPSAQFFAGEWTGDVGTWRVQYSEEEFCYVTRGKLLVKDEAGVETLIGAGDAFIVPAGFHGSWQVLEPVHKFYVIFEAKK